MNKSGKIVVLPLWLTTAVIVAGVALTVLFPFGFLGWISYVVVLVGAAAWGLWTRHCYAQRILERSDDALVLEIRRRGRGSQSSALDARVTR